MPARLNPRHQDMVRAKIQSSQLINRLQDHVLNGLELPPSAVTAALGLLKKCIPDLQCTELTGEGGGPLELSVVRFSDPPKQVDTEEVPALSLVRIGTGSAPRRTRESPP